MISATNSYFDNKNAKFSKKQNMIFAGILLLTAVLLLLVIRRGIGWGDDYALYIMHAQNIASGKPFAVTNYIPNPQAVWFSPVAYPPMYPLFLSLLYRMSGINFEVYKIGNLLLLIGFLVSAFLYLSRQFDFGTAVIGILMIGTNYCNVKHINSVCSEYLFMFSFLLTLLLMQKYFEMPGNNIRSGILTGICMFICAETRSIGIAVIPCFIVSAIYLKKKSFHKYLYPLGITVILIVFGKVLTNTGNNYALDFSAYLYSFQNILFDNIKAYFYAFPQVMIPKSQIFILFPILINAVCVIGSILFVKRKRENIVYFTFSYFYAAVLIVYPYEQDPLRYAFPLLLFSYSYFVECCDYFLKLLNSRIQWIGWNKLLPCALILICVLSVPLNIKEYQKTVEQPDGIFSDDTVQEMFTAVSDIGSSCSTENCGFYFRKARALALFADVRTGMVNDDDFSEEESFYEEAGKYHISYFVTDKENPAAFDDFYAKHSEDFITLYKNSRFSICQIKP